MFRKSLVLSLLPALFAVNVPAAEQALESSEKRGREAIAQQGEQWNQHAAEVQRIEQEARRWVGHQIM